MKFNSILVALDFSDVSSDAMEYAATLARRLRTRLDLVHVVESMPATALLEASKDLAETEANLQTEAVRRLDTLAKPLRTTIDCRTAVRLGRPDEEILWAVDDMGADLLVLGTHGFRGLEKLLLGSTTDRLLRRCTRPVLTVGPGSAQHPDHRPCIVYATDFSKGAYAAWPYACELARRLAARLLMIHVLERRGEDAEGQFRSLLEDECAAHLEDVETAVVDAPYQRGILEAAAKADARMIVMGREGQGRLEQMLLGSTVDRVIRMSECPVLTVRG